MAWRRTVDTLVSEPMMTHFTNAYMHHSAPMSEIHPGELMYTHGIQYSSSLDKKVDQ